MIVGPIPAQMDDFCDLHGTPDTPVSRIVTVKLHLELERTLLDQTVDEVEFELSRM